MGQRADGLGVLGHPGLVPLALSLSAVPRVGFDIPTPKIGGIEFTWPDFHYLLTAGDRTSAAMRSPGVALGVHLYDLRLGDKLRVSLLSSFSADASLGAGFRFGTDLRVLLPHGFQLIATPSYTIGTHLLDPEREVGGFRFNAAIRLPFR